MSSCEPKRASAYSEDLRWRMVWQRFVCGLTPRDVASNLCVDASTVMRTTKKSDATGLVGHSPRDVKISKPVQFIIINTSSSRQS